ncbi:hypothetical protein M9H77_23127 [Catharanthus roseus]|uniref:Uncharacterized protein n=1 Tax=Catharanthus roseus TaxID=4058 RepID=A0ACC0ASE9_CATRO|nr:hypothetical protein M9H77_23127 [Catharanthus roseus]
MCLSMKFLVNLHFFFMKHCSGFFLVNRRFLPVADPSVSLQLLPAAALSCRISGATSCFIGGAIWCSFFLCHCVVLQQRRVAAAPFFLCYFTAAAVFFESVLIVPLGVDNTKDGLKLGGEVDNIESDQRWNTPLGKFFFRSVATPESVKNIICQKAKEQAAATHMRRFVEQNHLVHSPIPSIMDLVQAVMATIPSSTTASGTLEARVSSSIPPSIDVPCTSTVDSPSAL